MSSKIERASLDLYGALARSIDTPARSSAVLSEELRGLIAAHGLDPAATYEVAGTALATARYRQPYYLERWLPVIAAAAGLDLNQVRTSFLDALGKISGGAREVPLEEFLARAQAVEPPGLEVAQIPPR